RPAFERAGREPEAFAAAVALADEPAPSRKRHRKRKRDERGRFVSDDEPIDEEDVSRRLQASVEHAAVTRWVVEAFTHRCLLVAGRAQQRGRDVLRLAQLFRALARIPIGDALAKLRWGDRDADESATPLTLPILRAF